MVEQQRHEETSLRLAPLGETPFVSIVIPCYNEERYIEAVVRGALGQSYPAERMEILVVDGRSSDRTRAIVRELAREDARIQLLDNPRRYQSAAMNVAIKCSRGEVIVRMDAHAEYAVDYVAASVAVLRETGALNAGGAARARHRGSFQRALCAALTSPLGVGGSAYRDPSREGFVESVWNGAFRREAFELAGLYDPDAATNEDAELNQRIIAAGGSIYLSRDVVVYYYPRESIDGLWHQYFSYGIGRARTALKLGRLLSLRPLVPFLTVTAFGLLAALAVIAPPAGALLAIGVAMYLGLIVAESIHVAAREDLGLLPPIIVIFLVMHLAHGIGFWAGLMKYAGVELNRAPLERLGHVRPARTTRG